MSWQPGAGQTGERRAFEPREPRRFVGRYQPRVDGAEKAAGQAEYLDDIALGKQPGLLHARSLRSPYPHARIVRMDTSKAEALPGVHCVLTYADPEVAALKPTTNAWTSMNTAGYDQMYWPSLRDRRVLSDHVTWAGDEAGAVVAAETEAIAEHALRLIEVEWEELPFALGKDDALADGAPLIHPEINPASNLFPNAEDTQEDVFFERGDVDAGLAAADVILDVSSRHHRADHGALDTRGCLVVWKGDKLTCWTNLYQADQTRIHIAEMLDLPLNKVRVLCPYVGGSFGRSNVGDQVFFIFTALLARRTGRPVRYKLTRHEDFHDTRNAIDYRIRVGVTKDGRITAMQTHAIGDSGGYAEHTMAAVKMVLELDALEVLLPHIPALRMIGHSVYTNTIPGGCMRGIGNSQLNMALGLLVDALGEELGLDPIDVAIKNFSHEWEEPPNASLTAVLRAGAERAGWERRQAPGSGPLIDGHRKRGLGFSFHHAWHAGWQEIIRGRVQVGIRVNPDLSVILQAPQAETGVGSNTCAVLACAEALDFLAVTPDRIEWINPADTETGLKDMVQTDSSVSYLFAEVMAPAAADIKRQVCALAAAQLQAPAEDIGIAAGRVMLRGEDAGTSVYDVLQAGDLVPLQATVTGEMPPLKTGAPYLAAFAEVEVDTETGKVDVVKLAIVHDAGTVMFPSGAEAQQIGAQVQGIGEALYEEIVYDRESGKPLSFDWVGYTMPTMLDMPVVDPVLLEVWRGAGEYGACGVGESALCCTPRAILNAIHNAVGVRINDIPVKPEKMLEALARKEQGLPGLDEELHLEITRCLDRALAVSEAAAAAKNATATDETAVASLSAAAGATDEDAAAAPKAAATDDLASAADTSAVTYRTAAGNGREAADAARTFRHTTAGGLDDAVAALSTDGVRSKPIAGGTDLLGVLKDRVHAEAPQVLVDLKPLAGLAGVAEDGDGATIGALTRIADLERDGLIREKWPVLAEAAHAVASPQLRAMGTVGGNLCQEPRCWYYRAPDNAFACTRKGGRYCNAFTGDNRFHSLLGPLQVDTRPCSAACPGGVEIPEYMELLRAGDLDAAARRLLSRNPLPAITGRVCPHTCETDCSRGLYDEAVSVRDVERFLGDRVLADPALVGRPDAETGRRVAVVGSGPAGLAAAHYLRLSGHAVTVFERAAELGGMLRYGIPAYRLRKDVVDGCVAVLEGIGVVFRTGVTFGADLALEDLRADHDAVFVATGAWGLPRIGLTGEEELPAGLEFLAAVAAGERRVPGPHVLVIGGGSVAMDVAVTARRLGAEKVTVACLETCEEMPALLEEVEEALQEGIELVPSCGPARILKDGDRLSGLELVRCTSVFDEECCFSPTFNESDRTIIAADEIILAVGQRVEAEQLAAAGLPLEGGRLAVSGDSQQTALPGVFAAGDVVTGPATVIAALAAGRRSAAGIDAYLAGDPAAGSSVPANTRAAAGAAAVADAQAAAAGSAASATKRAGPTTADGNGAGRFLAFDPSSLEHSSRSGLGPAAPEERTLCDEDCCTLAEPAVLGEARRCFNCGCVAVSAADLAPALVALDATVVTTTRELPTADLFAVGPGCTTVLAAGELVTAVKLPAPAPRSCYVKFRLRNTIDFPILSAAVALAVEDGRVAGARVALGAAAPVPVRVSQVEEALKGRPAAAVDDLVAAARAAAGEWAADCRPLAHNGYKTKIAVAMIARAVKGAAGR